VRLSRAHHRAAHHFPVCRSAYFPQNAQEALKHSVETFAGKTLQPNEYDEVAIHTEDFGAMMFAMGDSTRGSLTVSQVSGRRKNRLFIEIFGSKASAAWTGEDPDELWIGHRNAPNEIRIKDPVLMRVEAQSYTDLPGGHGEGYPDTFKQIFRRFYKRVMAANAPVDYPTFGDGIRQMRVLDTVLESSQKKGMGDGAGLGVFACYDGITFAWGR
jgi:predicted dehydrogenase